MQSWKGTAISILAAAAMTGPAFANGWYTAPHAAPFVHSCDELPGNARKVCQKQRKGERKIAKAYHKAERDPGPRSSYKLAKAQVKTRYKVNKQRCEALPDKHARKACEHHVKRAYQARKQALGPKPGSDW